MSSIGLNKWIVSGHLAADAEIKTVDLKNGEKAKVAKATIYVRKVRNRDESFTVSLSIWSGSTAWRRLPYLKKGSLIICTGNLEPNPYVSNSDNLPRAGLSMNVLDIDLDNVRLPDEEELPEGEVSVAIEEPTASTPASPAGKVAENGTASYPGKKLPPQEPASTPTPTTNSANSANPGKPATPKTTKVS